MRRRAAVAGLVAAGLAARAGPSRAAAQSMAATPIARLDLGWWRARHEAVLRRLREAPVELIFLGDSITQDWERTGPPDWADFRPVWDRFYGDRHAVNMGFTGDTTASLLWRIENGEVAGISPKVAVVLIGANNLGRVHWSADDTVAGIEAVIGQIRARLPHTRILLLAVLPSDRSDWASRTTIEINRALAGHYANRHDGADAVTYFDPTSLFTRNEVLDRSMFFDPLLSPPGPPLHPTAQAQLRLAEAIEPTLAAMLGDRDHRQPAAPR